MAVIAGSKFYFHQSANDLAKVQKVVDSLSINASSSLIEGQDITAAFLRPKGWHHILYTPTNFASIEDAPYAIVPTIGDVFWTEGARRTVFHGKKYDNNDKHRPEAAEAILVAEETLESILASGETPLPQNYEVNTNGIATYFPFYRQVWVEYPRENPPQIYISIKVGQPRPIEIIDSTLKTI